MNQHSEKPDDKELRDRIIGLGSLSHHKSYYPELKRRIADLERFRTLLNETGDAIFLIKADTRICIDINRAATTLTGYSADDFKTIRFEEILSPDLGDVSENQEVQNYLTASDGAVIREVLIHTADARQVQVELSIRSVTLANESFFVVVARDITDRKKAESELDEYRHHLEEMVEERSEELIVSNQELIHEIHQRTSIEKLLEEEKDLLEVTLKSIGDSVITTDIEGTITYLNYAAERLTGKPKQSVKDTPISDLLQIFRDNKPVKIGDLIQKVVSSGRPVIIEEGTGTFKFQTTKIVSVILSPIVQSSATTGIVFVIHDITERIRLNEEIQKHERLESLGVLAGGIAHDFNNVLTAILGNISLSLELIHESSPAAARIKEAEQATFRAKSLTQQLLTFSKGGAPVRKNSRIDELIKETAEFTASGSNVKIEYDFPEHLHQVEIDQGQISQVVQNLIINAQQAMPSGGRITISAGMVELSPDQVTGLAAGKYIRISFADEGQGIGKEAIPHIFEPYFTTKETGNGLGLTSSMFIMKKHQGTIEVFSEEGIGTVFTLWLPVSDQTISEKITLPPKKPCSQGGSILLMDDEEGILNVVSTLLHRAGWEVTCTHDGQEAITAYSAALNAGKPFDAVIMDLVIPGGIGGKDAIREIRLMDPGVFAIVSSGYSNDPVMSEPERYGFSRVLPKPYKIKDLLEILSQQ